MPTFEADDRFWNDFDRLRADQQQRFFEARDQFIALLLAWEAEGRPGIPRFPKALGVKPMAAHRNIMEFAWAPDGRCTWMYGTPRIPGRVHIIWRRIGTHAIYSEP
jgi:hypothetical protein